VWAVYRSNHYKILLGDFMTTELSILDWKDKPIRFIKEDEQTFVPVVDIAGAIGVDKRSCLRLLDRNSALFSSYERGVHLETLGGMQYTRCLNRDGTLGLLFKLSTNHVRDTAIREKLVEFQKWAIDKLSQVGTLRPAQLSESKEPDYSQCLIAVKFAQELSRLVDTDPLPLVRQALDHYDLGMYGGLIKPRTLLERHGIIDRPALPPAPPKPKLWLTPTDIGKEAGKTAQEINQWLWNNDYQRKDQQTDEWRITPKGKSIGGEERYEQYESGHLGWHVVWNRAVLRLFNIRDEHYEVG
jgi:hypothetical protein